MQKNLSQKTLAIIAAFIVCFSLVPIAQAAALTSVSDTMSRQIASTAANHTIVFTTPTGVSASQTITLTFPASFTGVSSLTLTDYDLQINGTDQTLVASGATAAQWNASVSGQVVTFQAGPSPSSSVGQPITIKIGTNASFGGAGSHQITNPSSTGTYNIAIGGTMSDSGTYAVVVTTNDQVSLSATVNTSLTFTVSNNTSSWASALSTAAPSAATTDITLTSASNLNSGYNVYISDVGSGTVGGLYNSTAGYNIVSATALLANGAEGYGVQATTSTAASLSATYNKSGLNVGGLTVAPQTLYSRAAANTSGTPTDSVVIHHIASIATYTKAGSYADTITYVASASY